MHLFVVLLCERSVIKMPALSLGFRDRRDRRSGRSGRSRGLGVVRPAYPRQINLFLSCELCSCRNPMGPSSWVLTEIYHKFQYPTTNGRWLANLLRSFHFPLMPAKSFQILNARWLLFVVIAVRSKPSAAYLPRLHWGKRVPWMISRKVP